MDNMEKKSILITGGMGYVGRNLIHILQTKFWKYLWKTFSVFDTKQGSEGDVRNCFDALLNADVVVHLAAHSNISLENDYNSIVNSNIDGLLFLIDKIKHIKITTGRDIRLINFSTSGVEQRSQKGAYVLSKMLGEAMLEDSGLPYWTSIRPCNIIGAVYPGGFDFPDENGHILPMLAKATELEVPFEVFGNGLQRRFYVHVYDLCMLVANMIFNKDFEPYHGTHFGVSGDKSYSINDVIDLWRAVIDPSLVVKGTGKSRRSDPTEIVVKVAYCMPFGLEKAITDYSRRLQWRAT